ncbi:BON domain-containing protein [Pseudomonas sp. DWP3-1-2]|uniref:BON domain-containing protein n=1 Tax=Pseudomonas sp. DWP3-1-2 TaxID=2804645 RepID=UPI003CF09019
MSDLTLRRDILDELEFRPHIDAAAIGVAVENGVATLTGHVRSYAEKIAAERAVKSVKGVRGVAEELQVRLPGTICLDDDVIASRCLELIQWNESLPADRIQVKVQSGWVTLEGEVDWQYQKEAAQGAIRKLTGVTGINNFLDIKPRINPDDTQTLIESALVRNVEVDATHICVTVDDRTVTLKGHVHSWAERKAAERTAWSAAGVTRVENHLLLA